MIKTTTEQHSKYAQVSCIAGSGNQGFLDSRSSVSQFNTPRAVCVDDVGNVIVSDYGNHKVRMITTGEEVVTIAGNGNKGYRDGDATSAQFNFPHGICIDKSENIIVSDTCNHQIRVLTVDGQVNTIAGNGSQGYSDGPALGCQFNQPWGICIDAKGCIIVADHRNHCIRKISSASPAFVTTIGGTGTMGSKDGPSEDSEFNAPWGVCVDKKNNIVVSDHRNHKIRMIKASGEVITIAGNGNKGFRDGPCEEAEFNYPCGVCIDHWGNILVSDYDNHRIRVIADGYVSTISGSGFKGHENGDPLNSHFNSPCGICVDKDGNILVADKFNHQIRVIFVHENLLQHDDTVAMNNLKRLYFDERFKDYTFNLKDSSIKCHSFIIKARFPILLQKSTMSRIKKIEKKIFLVILEFIYINYIDLKYYTMEELFIVWKYSRLFLIHELEILVRNSLRKNLEFSNIMEYMDRAESEELTDDYGYVAHFIVINKSQFKKKIPKSAPLIKWAKKQKYNDEELICHNDYIDEFVEIVEQFKYCDCVIHVTDVFNDSKEIPVHLAILAQGSTYFPYDEHIKHKTNLRCSAFGALIKYWYTGKLLCDEIDCLFILIWGEIYLKSEDCLIVSRSCKKRLRHCKSSAKIELTNFICTNFTYQMLEEIVEMESIQNVLPELYSHCFNLVSQDAALKEVILNSDIIETMIEEKIEFMRTNFTEYENSLQNQIDTLHQSLGKLKSKMKKIVKLVEEIS